MCLCNTSNRGFYDWSQVWKRISFISHCKYIIEMWLVRAVQHMLHVVAWVQIFVTKYDSWSANEWQKCAVPWKYLSCFRLSHFPTGEKWEWMNHVQQHIEMKPHFLQAFQGWMGICGYIRTSHIYGWPTFWEQLLEWGAIQGSVPTYVWKSSLVTQNLDVQL